MNVRDTFFNFIIETFEMVEEIPTNYYIIYIYGKRNMMLEPSPQTKKVYMDFLEKNKEINIGICKEDILNSFFKDLEKDYQKRLDHIRNYISKSREEVYIHSTDVEITSIKKKPRDSFYGETFQFNPGGFWYSCGTAWLDWAYGKHGEYVNDIENKFNSGNYTTFSWYPFHVYKVFLAELKIGEIEDCQDLYDFSKTYKSTDLNEDRYISVEKIIKDYDGIQICPYLAIKCNDFFRKMLPPGKSGTNSDDIRVDWMKVLSLALNDKISNRDKSILWSYRWEAATGVVLNNLDKIKLFKLL